MGNTESTEGSHLEECPIDHKKESTDQKKECPIDHKNMKDENISECPVVKKKYKSPHSYTVYGEKIDPNNNMPYKPDIEVCISLISNKSTTTKTRIIIRKKKEYNTKRRYRRNMVISIRTNVLQFLKKKKQIR
jgi:hypothetical protein